MRTVVAVLVAMTGCGDDVTTTAPDATETTDATPTDGPTGFFGEPCTVDKRTGVVVLCHSGEGACNEEGGIGVCRPFCYTVDIPQTETCKARGGVCVDSEPTGSAYVCVPK